MIQTEKRGTISTLKRPLPTKRKGQVTFRWTLIDDPLLFHIPVPKAKEFRRRRPREALAKSSISALNRRWKPERERASPWSVVPTITIFLKNTDPCSRYSGQAITSVVLRQLLQTLALVVLDVQLDHGLP